MDESSRTSSRKTASQPPSVDLESLNGSEQAPSEVESDEVIFHDHSGKKFVFPYKESTTWEGVESLIRDAYARSRDNEIKQEVFNGEFDVVNGSNETILPNIWASLVKPGLRVYLSLWSRPRSEIGSGFSGGDPGGLPGSRADVSERYESVGVSRGRRTSRSPPQEVLTLDDFNNFNNDEWNNDEPNNEESNHDESEDDEFEDNYSSGSETLAEEEEDEAAQKELLSSGRPRVAVVPTGKNGEKLSLQVNTTTSKAPERQPKPAYSPTKARKAMTREHFNVLKTHLATSANRTSLHLHIASGPQNSLVESNVNIRWYHLYGNDLDFSQFKDVCLAIPGLSSRLKTLASELLDHIEKQKVKPFINGFYVVPGTVLRADETNRTEKDNLAAIFSCVPYFEIQDLDASEDVIAPSHPPRSLMQSYYPLESTAERDREQAYRKNSNMSKIVYVPLMWMMSIGPNIMVTCGHKPLSESLGKSVTFREELVESSNLQTSSTHESLPAHPTITVKLTDWDGRRMLYTIDECSTYFELEQKLRELRPTALSSATNNLQLCWINGEVGKPLTPGGWRGVLDTPNILIINVSVLGKDETAALEKERQADAFNSCKRVDSVPPFFQWPRPNGPNRLREDLASKDQRLKDDNPDTANPRVTITGDHSSERQSMRNLSPEKQESYCLDMVGRKFESETLDLFITYNILEEDFKSTKYYTDLPESTLMQLQTKYDFLLSKEKSSLAGDSDHHREQTGSSHDSAATKHGTIVRYQATQLRSYSTDLVTFLERMLGYFVSDVNKNAMLRKVWGAAANILQIIETRVKTSQTSQPPHGTSEQQSDAKVWTVRSPANSLEKGKFTAMSEDDELTGIISRCKKCQARFDSRENAKNHLRMHAQELGSEEENNNSDDVDLDDYIRHDDQTLVEETNAAYLAILSRSLEGARTLLPQMDDIAKGVQTKDGALFDRYTLPQELLKSLRMCLVFFFAVERSFSHTSAMFTKYPRYMGKSTVRDRDFEGIPTPHEIPFGKDGLGVLDRFCDRAKMSLSQVRRELCIMVRSDPPEDIMARLSLGPEYVLGWCMRRLLVKPLEKSMRVADLYRQYLSTLQFQVNHHPNKRLLRALNLLQEELDALETVNDWQQTLIGNYAAVLNDMSYESEMLPRKALFPYERSLLMSCLDPVLNDHEDYVQLTKRCGPLGESVKQSTEINEEDHGKAILVFTIVTGIFLPLSFVTSYLGMNTNDIRNMTQNQSLFWEISIPLTVVTLGSILLVAYNGDSIRDRFIALGNIIAGKKSSHRSRNGRSRPSDSDSGPTAARIRPADDAEFAMPIAPGQFNMGDRFGFMENQLTGMLKTSAPTMLKTEPLLIESRPARAAPQIMSRLVQSTHARVERPPPPPPPAPMPTVGGTGMPSAANATSSRINKRFVDVETLEFYKLPWEYDPQDPNYYIVMKPLEYSEQAMLFGHTARLRGKKAPKYPGVDMDNEDDYGRRDYVWGKRRRR